MPDTETTLINRAQSGDAEAFAELAGRYERRIFSLALHYTHDTQDAEDLSQEVWLRAYRAIAGFKGESGFYTWIRRITINCFLNGERPVPRRWWSMAAEPDQESLQTNVAHSANMERSLQDRILLAKVEAALSQLTPRQRLIFILKHHEGMTYEEIAKSVGCSTGTAKKAVARALAKLREELHVTPDSSDCVPCAAGQF
jgi:RNA polymerase sigma-70 factor (ECF subfamily)